VPEVGPRPNGFRMDTFLDALRWAHEHGIWELASFLIFVGGIIIGARFVFFPRRRIRNLNFYTRAARNTHPQFPLIIYLEIRNYTGCTVVLSSPFISYRNLRPPPEAHGDSPSGEYEIKFPDPGNQTLSEVEAFLRNKESTNTIIPLDPTHSDQEVRTALSHKRLGSLTLTCTWLQDKPVVEKLRRAI
jgi:hypothetical protein